MRTPILPPGGPRCTAPTATGTPPHIVGDLTIAEGDWVQGRGYTSPSPPVGGTPDAEPRWKAQPVDGEPTRSTGDPSRHWHRCRPHRCDAVRPASWVDNSECFAGFIAQRRSSTLVDVVVGFIVDTSTVTTPRCAGMWDAEPRAWAAGRRGYPIVLREGAECGLRFRWETSK